MKIIKAILALTLAVTLVAVAANEATWDPLPASHSVEVFTQKPSPTGVGLTYTPLATAEAGEKSVSFTLPSGVHTIVARSRVGDIVSDWSEPHTFTIPQIPQNLRVRITLDFSTNP
jgi:hypothetical protein